MIRLKLSKKNTQILILLRVMLSLLNKPKIRCGADALRTSMVLAQYVHKMLWNRDVLKLSAVYHVSNYARHQLIHLWL